MANAKNGMIDLVASGIVLDDIVTWRGDVQMGVLGGGGAQAAWGMAIAAPEARRAGLVGGVHEAEPAALFAPLVAAGVDLAGVRRSVVPTARAWQLIEQDETRTQVWRVPPSVLSEQLRRRLDDVPPTYWDARWFHWGIHPEQPDLDLARQLTLLGRRVSLEAFRAPDAPLTPEALAVMMANCAVFSAGLREAQEMVGAGEVEAVIAHFAAAGCRILTLRMGSAGSLIVDFDQMQRIHVPAYPAHVADTTGAGNAYCGALLARLDEGLPLAACHAAAAASFMVESVGIPPQLPSAQEYALRVEWVRRGLQISPA